MIGLGAFSLSGRCAIVTGAARGNGLAIASGLHRAGASVLLVDIAQTVGDVAVGLGGGCYGLCVDITDRSAPGAVLSEASRLFGQIDILVNNAGIGVKEDGQLYSEESWERTIAVNLTAAFRLSQAVVPTMIQAGRGSIINVTSLGAFQGFTGNPAYVASKGALSQLSKAQAKDWGRHGVRVNNIAPGYIETELSKPGWSDPVARKEREDRTMLGRWGQPEDLAGPAVFLASDASMYMTGADLVVDGGWLANGV